MEEIDFIALCKRQGELSSAYVKQQFQKRKIAREKYPPYKCVLCHHNKFGFGNNPDPCSDTGRCCNECNTSKVIPARVKQFELLVEKKIEEKKTG
jgi:hypothetical protein